MLGARVVYLDIMRPFAETALQRYNMLGLEILLLNRVSSEQDKADAYMHTYICMHACMYVRMCICIYACVYVHM